MPTSEVCNTVLSNDCRTEAFSRLLELACTHCFVGAIDQPTSLPCREADDQELAELALTIFFNWAGTFARHCALAFFASVLITFQYSISTRVLELDAGLLAFADQFGGSKSEFTLSPFPFWSEQRGLASQLAFHSKFFAVHLHLCDDSDASVERSRGRYVLRAGHDKPEAECSVRLSDFQLVKRCRARRRALPRAAAGRDGQGAAWPPRTEARDEARAEARDEARTEARPLALEGLGCPGAAAQQRFRERRAEGELQRRAMGKYERRAADGGCAEPRAEWMRDLALHHKCILLVILERLQLRPGMRVLDWGSGCGHKLSWAAQLYDLEVLGLDLVEESVQWQRQHMLGRSCAVDGRFLSWLPRAAFDAVISYAALSHLEPPEQCLVVLELLDKVRPGGGLWFGWNAPAVWANASEQQRGWMYPVETWQDCFRRTSVPMRWETEQEAFLFPSDASRAETYLYWPPAYSLFVTRLG